MDQQEKKKFSKLAADILTLADRRDRGQPISKDQVDDIKKRLNEFRPKKIVKEIKQQIEILYSRSDDNSDGGGKESRGGYEFLRKAVKIALATAGIGSAIVGTAAATTYGNRLGDDAYSASGHLVSAAVASISNGFNDEPSAIGNLATRNDQQASPASTPSVSTTRNGNVPAHVAAVPE